MAKILIAGLGKGFEDRDTKEWKYSSANYRIDGEEKVYEERSFITSALEEHFNIDKTIYIGTTGSMWDKLYEHYYEGEIINEADKNYKNLLLNITKNATKDTEIEKFPIDKFNQDFNDRAEGIITKYGMNSKEIYEIFNNIINRINFFIENSNDEEHELYLDITHSFRSNAMWMFLVINYLTDILNENIKIKMISYGMFEAKYKDENDKVIAPIVNLVAFYDLMKWIKGANAFKEYGNSYEFLDMIEDDKLKSSLEEFSNSMNMNYIGNIKENIENLNKIKEIMETLDGPAKLLLPEILNEFVDTFKKEEEIYWTMLKLASWHCNQKRYSMAYVNIVESIYTFAGENLDIDDINKNKEKLRAWINEINQENRSNYKNLSEEEKDNRIKLSKIFEESRIIRNNITHTLENKVEMLKIISKIKENIKELKKIFKMKYTNEIQKSKNLKSQSTYDFLEEIAEKNEFEEIGKIASNGIYDFLFEVLNVEKSGENKNIVKNWLDSKKENFEKISEKEQLSELMKYFAEVKNNKRRATKQEIIKKIRHLKNIIINKSFLEAFKNINLSVTNKNKDKININKENKAILIFTEISEEEKKELIKKYKIERIKNLSSKMKIEWENVQNDDNKEKTISRFKKIVEENIEGGDILLIKEEIGNVHRKGATPAYKDELLLIPGSMGHDSYLLSGMGNEKWLQSASHGAGRSVSRNEMSFKGKKNKGLLGLEGVECIT